MLNSAGLLLLVLAISAAAQCSHSRWGRHSGGGGGFFGGNNNNGLTLGADGVPTSGRLTEVFRWKQIEFDQLQENSSNVHFGDDADQLAIEQQEHQSALNANYVAYNNVPMGVTHHKGRLFVTIPRRRPGIPATLNFISTKATLQSSPTFRAYPSYRQNELPSTAGNGSAQPGIVSVYRTRVDECNRLWFIDTGLLEYPNNAQQIQRPSIWVIDLATDEVIRRFEIPEEIVTRGNGLASITVDVNSNSCDAAFAYIPDLANYRLYTYDFQLNRIWSISHNYFHFDPVNGDFNVGGQKFQWDDGIFSVTLGPRRADNDRLAYFHPMVSTNEFAINTKFLKNPDFATNSTSQFMNLGSRGPNTQSAMHDYDSRLNVIFHSQVATNGVSCWNVKKPIGQQVQLQHNAQTMIYPSDLNIDSEGYLWMMTNSMPIFIYSRLDTEVYNFRIWRAKTSELVRGTACAEQQWLF